MVRIFVIQPISNEGPLNKKLARILENQKYTLIKERHSEIATLKMILQTVPENEDILYLHSQSIPMITRSEFDELMEEIPKEKADFFSLCRWMDRCQNNADCRELTKTIHSVRTRGAFNLHVAWISHTAREFFLGITYLGEILKAQQEGRLYSRVTFTNCFEYDLTYAQSDVDRLKRFPCQFADAASRSEIVSYLTVQEEKKKLQAAIIKERDEQVKKAQSAWNWNNEYDAYKHSGGLFTNGLGFLVKLLFFLLIIFILWRALRK
jgi:hypothetical protein